MSYRYGYYRPRQVQSGGGIVSQAIGFIAVVAAVLFLADKMGFIDVSRLKPNISEGSGSRRAGGGGSSSDSQRILKEAYKYDNVKYEPAGYEWAGGHPPKDYSPGKGLDCSGLINVAVYKATGIHEDQVSQSFMFSRHWKPIHKKNARAGDIMYDLKDPGEFTGHVVFVVENKGSGKLTIFEARTSRGPVKDQIRKSYNQSYDRFDGALRFTKKPWK